jgi:ligand-binding sensor domain-containing protein/serine phosphatase RsbU (regulator of sigma subunit)
VVLRLVLLSSLSLTVLAGRLGVVAMTTSAGLVHNRVRCLLEDRQGTLWIGTQGGLSRFDGFQFENFSLEEQLGTDDVLQLLEDPQGRLWILTSQGVAFWDGSALRFPAWNSRLADRQPKSFVLGRDGRLWFLTRTGLLAAWDLTGEVLEDVADLREKELTCLLEDSRGGLWAGTRQNGVLCFQPHSGQWRATVGAFTVNSLLEVEPGRIWALTHQGVLEHSEKGWHAPIDLPPHDEPIVYEAMKTPDALVLRAFSGCFRLIADRWEPILPPMERPLLFSQWLLDSSGKLWLASNQGVWLDHGDAFLDHYDMGDGLSGNLVSALLEDRSGNVWVGTQSGLNRLDRPQIEVLFEDAPRAVPPPHSQVFRLFKGRGERVWAPNHQGLCRIDPSGEIVTFGSQHGLPPSPVHAFLEAADGTLWLGTAQGLLVGRAGLFQPEAQDLCQDRPVVQILQDRNRSIWILRGDGQLIQSEDGKIFHPRNPPRAWPVEEIRLDGDGNLGIAGNGQFDRVLAGSFEELPPLPLAPEEVHAFALGGRGTLWLATPNGLMAHGSGGNHLLGTTQGMPPGEPSGLFQSGNGVLWLNLRAPGAGRPLGLARYDGFSFQPWNRQMGLLADEITGVTELPDGTIWLLHRRGCSRIRGTDVRTFGVSQGLAGNSPRTILQDPDGNTWVATSGGLSKIHENLVTSYATRDGLPDPDVTDILPLGRHMILRTRSSICLFKENPVPPVVRIVRVEREGQALNPAVKTKLPAINNDLTLHLQAISLSRGSDRILFQYKTRADQPDWIGPLRDPRIALNNLSPGDYTILVRALSRDLHPSVQPASYSFSIQPPFYQTLWFLLIILLLSLGGAALLYRLRLATSLRRAKIQNELQVAHELQMGLMPRSQPQLAAIDICGYCQPALEVGGDYYDYFWLEEPTIGLAVIDVSGHSMEAAIIAVMTSGLLYGEAANERSPARILEKINLPLVRKTARKTFVAGLFATFNEQTRELRFASAGQCAPLLLRGGEISVLRPGRGNLPMGIKALALEETTLSLKRGDLLFFYTDGLTEASNPENEMFGLGSLSRVLQNLDQNSSAAAVLDAVQQALTHFCRESAPLDDITMVAMRIVA